MHFVVAQTRLPEQSVVEVGALLRLHCLHVAQMLARRGRGERTGHVGSINLLVLTVVSLTDRDETPTSGLLLAKVRMRGVVW